MNIPYGRKLVDHYGYVDTEWMKYFESLKALPDSISQKEMLDKVDELVKHLNAKTKKPKALETQETPETQKEPQ